MLQQLRELLEDYEQLREQPGSYLFGDESLEHLSGQERRVLELRYGLGGKDRHTLEEVAEVFNISRERARQIESEAFEKLRELGRPAWFLEECTSSPVNHVRQQVWQVAREWFQAQRPHLFLQTRIEKHYFEETECGEVSLRMRIERNQAIFAETVCGEDSSYLTYYRNRDRIYWFAGILEGLEGDETTAWEMHKGCVDLVMDMLYSQTPEARIYRSIFGSPPEPESDSLKIRVDNEGRVETC